MEGRDQRWELSLSRPTATYKAHKSMSVYRVVLVLFGDFV